MVAAPTIFTIGHSNHTWDSFAPLLKQHRIQVLVDVRTNPASRFASFANKRRCCQSAKVGQIGTREDHYYKELRVNSLRVLL